MNCEFWLLKALKIFDVCVWDPTNLFYNLHMFFNVPMLFISFCTHYLIMFYSIFLRFCHDFKNDVFLCIKVIIERRSGTICLGCSWHLSNVTSLRIRYLIETRRPVKIISCRSDTTIILDPRFWKLLSITVNTKLVGPIDHLV